MKYSIHLDHTLKIIRYRHSGLIYAEEIEDAWSKFLAIPEFTHSHYNLLSDYRGGTFKMQLEDISMIIDYMKAIEPIVKGKKQALIVDDPYSVAGSMLFENKVYREVGFIVKVFSTEEAALKWLQY